MGLRNFKKNVLVAIAVSALSIQISLADKLSDASSECGKCAMLEMMHDSYLNLAGRIYFAEGAPATGVRNWAKKNGVNLVSYELMKDVFNARWASLCSKLTLANNDKNISFAVITHAKKDLKMVRDYILDILVPETADLKTSYPDLFRIHDELNRDLPGMSYKDIMKKVGSCRAKTIKLVDSL